MAFDSMENILRKQGRQLVQRKIKTITLKRKPMDKDQKNQQGKPDEKKKSSGERKQHLEEKIDEELNQSFPASDPPSYSQPGNDDIKEGCK